MKTTILSFILISFLFASCQNSPQPPKPIVQSDTVMAVFADKIPVFDGIGDDECWQKTQWKLINQMWIPWGTKIDSADFYGRFKVAWSEKENLVYFLVQITDDTFVSDYKFSASTDSITYPHFDLVELFIDEDKSGGMHVFDNGGAEWGENAENAFAYHIIPGKPIEGKLITTCDAMDIAGKGGMKTGYVVNYNAHFSNFTVHKIGNQYFWEFALKIYNDTYENSNLEKSRVTLKSGKMMGFSIAYCENDVNDLNRDNFIGSVKVSEDRYNDHWKDASLFGKLILEAK